MVYCKSVLSTNDVVVGDTHKYVIILFSIFVFFRGLGAVILIQKAKRFY
jgi:hypothetical protein